MAEEGETAGPGGHALNEATVIRRAMINTMRLFHADDLGRDPELFKQTVLDTLDLVREQAKEQGKHATAAPPSTALRALEPRARCGARTT